MGFFGKIKDFFKKGVIFPAKEKALPLSTSFGPHIVTFHMNGTISGDYHAVEKWLKETETDDFAESRILFWMMLQMWKAQINQQLAVKVANTTAAPSSQPSMMINNTSLVNAIPEVKKAPAPKVEVIPSVSKNAAGKPVYKTVAKKVEEPEKKQEEEIFKYL